MTERENEYLTMLAGSSTNGWDTLLPIFKISNGELSPGMGVAYIRECAEEYKDGKARTYIRITHPDFVIGLQVREGEVTAAGMAKTRYVKPL